MVNFVSTWVKIDTKRNKQESKGFDLQIKNVDIGVDFLLIKQILRRQNFFYQVWLNLISIDTISLCCGLWVPILQLQA